MGALCGCRAVKFGTCNNLLSSLYTILVIILWYVRLNIKTKILLLLFKLLLFIITRVTDNTLGRGTEYHSGCPHKVD